MGALGGDDPIAARHRTHREVQQLRGLLARMTADLPDEGPGQAETNDFRRVIYGLGAIMRLHFAQENEPTTAWPTPTAPNTRL